MTTGHEVDEVKAQARTTWALGDYERIAARQQPIADALCGWVRVAPGEAVLDVATATGNVALAAAGHGATVTGIDLTPRMLAQARARAAASSRPVTFVEGDAENLPFADGDFDVVLSACGLWFAPRPLVAAREAARVLRAGGRIGLANFTPTGFWGQVTEIVKRWLPPPDGVPEPNDWGTEDAVHERLERWFADVETCRETVRYEFEDVAAATSFFATYSPPHVAARQTLPPDRAEAMLAEIGAFTAATATRSMTGAALLDAEYLLVRAGVR